LIQTKYNGKGNTKAAVTHECRPGRISECISGLLEYRQTYVISYLVYRPNNSCHRWAPKRICQNHANYNGPDK